jgi:hypothetical protein
MGFHGNSKKNEKEHHLSGKIWAESSGEYQKDKKTVKNQTQIAELLNNQECPGLSVVRARVEEGAGVTS